MNINHILSTSKDLVLALNDIDFSGEYHLVRVVYDEDGGRFQPESGVDYMFTNDKLKFVNGLCVWNFTLIVRNERIRS